MHYDYLIVGAGLYGSVFANCLAKAGKKVLVIDKRKHIGGNCYTKNTDGINVHMYGAHIFHTNNKKVWDYVNNLAEFNNYINSPVAIYKNEVYNLPFNMNTFAKMWGVKTPKEAMDKIESQKASFTGEPKNLEEQAISLVGKDVYEKLVKGYTEKQWGRDCSELPAFIIKRLPLRFTYDNNYFNDRYQGIPIGGYTGIFEKLLNEQGISVRLETTFKNYTETKGSDSFDNLLYTGPIDEFFDYEKGHLSFRSLKFETVKLKENNYQGNAVVNYTERSVPFTRIIEHKHFEYKNPDEVEGTIITREFSNEWKPGIEPYYPVNDETNNALYEEYKALSVTNLANEIAGCKGNVFFGGRLGTYAYYDMDKVIELALGSAEITLKKS